MTETVTPAPTPAPTAQPPRRNLIGLIAMIIAIIGFIFAVIPVIAFIAWLPLLAAFVLSIIGLTRKGLSKGTSITAIILSVVGWIVSIIVSLVLVGAALSSSDSTTVQPGSPSASASASASALPGIGAEVTNRDGVAFTVSAVQCGEKSAPQIIYGTVAPVGDFCQVDFTVKNGSQQSIDLSNSSLEGYIGTTKYDAADTAGHFGNDTLLSSLNPGLTTTATLYVDVPVGATLDTVQLNTSFGLGTAVTIATK
jgi:hypothetical protein